MKEDRYKYLFWCAPLIGAALTACVVFILVDNQEYIDGKTYGHLSPAPPYYLMLIFIYLTALVFTMICTYGYLALLNRFPRYYRVLTATAVLASVFFVLKAGIGMYAHKKGVVEQLPVLAVFTAWASLYFIPVYWAAYNYVGRRK